MANKSLVPEARVALDKFKMEAASDVGVNLKSGYNGDLTSKQAGSIGGQMVKNVCTEQQSIFSRQTRNKTGHSTDVRYNIYVF